MDKEKYNEIVQFFRNDSNVMSDRWYYVFSICGPDALSWLDPSMWDNFDDMWCRFHKGFRQCDFNNNLVRLADDHKKIEENLCGYMDGLIWVLIKEDKGYLYHVLKELFEGAEWKK